MLVQALAEYADTRLQDQLGDPAFETKPVPVVLEIAPDGKFLTFIPHEETVTFGKKTKTRPRSHLVPKSPVNRNSGAHPLLAYDDAKYLFGKGPWTKAGQEADHLEKHQEFVALLSAAARRTGDAALAACVRFYEQPQQVERALNALDAGQTAGIMLSVDGPVIDRPDVKSFWRDHFQAKSDTRNEKGGIGMCLVSGRIGPVAPTHELIKGAGAIRGKASGVALMSFNEPSFESYGWDRNANSPVSPDRARAYVLALNDLLGRDRNARIVHNGVAFLYWTRKPVEENPMLILDNPDPEAVRRLLLLQSSGEAISDPNDFYLLAVSGNGGRLMVRNWFQDSLERVLRHVADWFEGLQIRNVFSGDTADPPPLWRLLKTLAREDPLPDREVQLIRRALMGVPLGRGILAGALARLRIAVGADRLSPVRAAMIRLATNDQIAMKGESLLSEQLDPGLDHEAYLCGRLLAIYDNLQYAAHEQEVGVSVADRYFSLASTLPEVAFPKIIDLGLRHLKKLRRDNRKAAVAIERDIQSVLSRLTESGFPVRLSLEDQGRFAIGFYHQRAEGMARAKERKQKKEEGEQE